MFSFTYWRLYMEIVLALLAATLFFLLQKYLYRKNWDKNLSIDLQFSVTHCMEGENAYLTQTITNQKLLPLPILRLKFQTSRNLIFFDNTNSQVSDNYYRNDMVSLIMCQKLTRNLSFFCSRRGYYTINQCDLVCSDLFIYDTMVKNIPLAISLYVYPRYIDDVYINPTFHKILGNVLTKRFFNEDPFEFAGIRQYQIYDTLKSINWNASAKTGELKVNVHDTTSSQQVKILLNLESPTIWIFDDLLEESIRLAASLANLFIKRGIPTGVYSNGRDLITKETLTIPPGSGNNHMTSICEGLSRIDTSLPARSFVSFSEELLNVKNRNACLSQSFHNENDYYIIISSYQKEDLQNLLKTAFYKKQDYYHWIIPINKESSITVDPYFYPFTTPWSIKE